MLNLSVGLEVPGLVIEPKVRVNVWTGMKVELARFVTVTLFSSTFTATVGVLTLVPDALTDGSVAASLIDWGKTISSQPVELSLSFKTIENTYKVFALTNKFWGPTDPSKLDSVALTVVVPIIFWNPFRRTYTVIGSLSLIDGGAVIV